MPPKFSEGHFDFQDGALTPEHVEGWPFDSRPPQRDELDPAKYHILETDGLSGADFAIAVDIDTLDGAKFLTEARRRFLTEHNALEPSGLPRIVHPKPSPSSYSLT